MSHSSDNESAGRTTIVIILVALAYTGVQFYTLQRDVDSLKDRAQIAANPQDMLLYVRAMRDNMVKHEVTAGHTALLLRTPATNLALHFQAVNSVIVRLEQVEGLPPDSAAYQTALDDVRGVLREMPQLAAPVYWVRYGWWATPLALVLAAVVSA
jgi:hypothetical protein